MTDTEADADEVEDLDAIVAAADRFIRKQLPSASVDAVDRGDIDAMFAARSSVEPAEIWNAWRPADASFRLGQSSTVASAFLRGRLRQPCAFSVGTDYRRSRAR